MKEIKENNIKNTNDIIEKRTDNIITEKNSTTNIDNIAAEKNSAININNASDKNSAININSASDKNSTINISDTSDKNNTANINSTSAKINNITNANNITNSGNITNNVNDIKINNTSDIQIKYNDDLLNENIIKAKNIPEYGNIEPMFVKDSKKNKDKKAFDDARQYLSIVLSELEEARAEIDNLKSIQKKKKRNGWKVLAYAEAAALAAVLVVVGIYSIRQNFTSKNNQDKPVYSDNDNKTFENIPQSKSYINIIDNLEDKVKAIKNMPEGFNCDISEENDREALVFTCDGISIGYYNEYEGIGEVSASMKRIFIENGTRRLEFNTDFSFEENIEELCPRIIQNDDGRSFIMFLDKNNNANIPKSIMYVDLQSFAMSNSFDVLAAFNDLFEVSYEEVYNVDETEDGRCDYRMIIKSGGASYTYSIPEEVYNIAAYEDESCLMFDKNFVLNVEKDKISVEAEVYIDDNAYVGRITADIVIEDRDLGFNNIKYGAYADAEYEDSNSDKILVVKESPYKEFVTISGTNKERLLIEISNKVERNTLDWSNVVTDENGYKSYIDENGAVNTIMGIDVSKYQGNIDWEKVREAGAGFAIIRLGYRGMNEGTLEFDPYFEQNIKGAIKAGIPVGIYFFSQAVNEKEAEEEADMVLKAIKNYEIRYPVIFDTEIVTTYNARANNLTRNERTLIAKAFLDKISNAGYNAMIYANTRWFITGLDLELISEYDRWYAYYGDEVTFPYSFDIIQYSDTGRIDGINGAVDLNMCFKKY